MSDTGVSASQARTRSGPASGHPAIVARDLHLAYRPYVERRPTLAGAIKRTRRHVEEVHALRGVSLTVYRGEALGIIGRNGAGKSTLMQVLSGALPPDNGSVQVFGRTSALLGLGVGFDRRLSGRRNIYLAALASGMRKGEVDAVLDEIIAFSELGDAIDRPVSTFSAGMHQRLAFAIAVQARPEILLLDEALAVGDEAFRAKSNESMRQLLDEAGTIVIVSHALTRLRRMCDRVAWLDQGELRQVGPAQRVIGAYRAEHGAPGPPDDD